MYPAGRGGQGLGRTAPGDVRRARGLAAESPGAAAGGDGDGVRGGQRHHPAQRVCARCSALSTTSGSGISWTSASRNGATSCAGAGEIFPVLFTNPQDRMSTVRCVPASIIERIEWREGRLRGGAALQGGRAWPARTGGTLVGVAAASERCRTSRTPVMLHYAVNRPVGALRGESDLAPILPWLKRYSRWLEDRVRLNAGVRAFLWVVKAPARLRAELAERYRQPPEPGRVIIADEQETWTAVAPNLNANDAAQRRPRHPLDDRGRWAGHVAARPRRRRGLQPGHRPGDDRDAAAIPAPAAGLYGLAAVRPGAGGVAALCSGRQARAGGR